MPTRFPARVYDICCAAILERTLRSVLRSPLHGWPRQPAGRCAELSGSRLSAGAATSSVAAGAAGCPEPVVQPDMQPAARPAGRALFGATADSSPYSEPGVFFFPPSPDETSQSDAGPPGVCFLFVYALRAHCLMLCFADFTALTAARAFFCPESRPRSLRRTAHETRSTKHSRKQRTRSA